MPGVVFVVLSSFALLVGGKEGPSGDSHEPWSGIPRMQGDKPVPLAAGPKDWDLLGAKGLALVETVVLPPGRPLAVASARPGQTWVLIDQPPPGLPGIDPKINAPNLVRIAREEGVWKVTAKFPAPDGARTLVAQDDQLLVGAPDCLWLLTVGSKVPPRKLAEAKTGNRDVPVPCLDELGNILVALGPGKWQFPEGAGSVEIPGGAWGIVGLPPDHKRSLLWSTGMGPVYRWLSSSGEGELFASDQIDGATHLRLLRVGNDGGFRRGTAGDFGKGFNAGDIGAISPLVSRESGGISCGLALGESLGQDWKGRLLVGENGRLLALSTTANLSPTRTLTGRMVVLEGPPAKFLPVGLAEEKGGEGLWVLVSPRDFKLAGSLPLEDVPSGNLLLVQDQNASNKKEAICGPLAARPTIRDELEHFPAGIARVSKAREMVKSGAVPVDQVAQLCLDTAVDGKLRQSAWLGLSGSGQVIPFLSKLLATDNPRIKASACRFCCFLKQLPQEAVNPLLDCLQDPDENVVREAACAAGIHHLPGAAESLGAILFQRDEADPQTQSGALFGLGRLGAEGADKMLSSAQTGVRAEAVRALKARVGYPWPAGQAGKAEVWLDHPHLGPEHLALYFQGLLAWKGWNGAGSAGRNPGDPVEKTIAESLAWLETHSDQQAEVLEAGLRLSGSLPLEQAPLDWWRLMAREQKGKVCALALGNMARLKRPAWAGEILTELEREDLSSAERLAGIRLMREWGQAAAAIRLAVSLLEPGVIPGQDPAVTKEALDCLEEFDPVRAREAAFRVIQSPKAILLPMAKAAEILARDSESRSTINQSFVEGQSVKFPFLAWHLWVDALARTGAGEDLDQTIYANWLGTESGRRKLRNGVKNQGNPRRGLFVFLNRNRAQCVDCHSIQGNGGGLAPVLTPGKEPEIVLESMVRPGAKVHPNFPLVSVMGPDGQQFRGVLLRSISVVGKTWVIANQGGRTVQLTENDSGPPTSIPGSLMPSIGDRHLTYQEILDLLAFLANSGDVKERDPLAGMVVEAIRTDGGASGDEKIYSNPMGLLVVPTGKQKIAVFLQADQPGMAHLNLFGANLAPEQPNSLPVTKMWQQFFIEVVVPPGNGKTPIALRLSGPQGLAIGAFPR